jgi:hypothetical protein
MIHAKQYIFIDDSGDPGFKGAASSHFVIACALFMDDLTAEEAALLMKKYRRSLGWPDHREFKFAKTKKEYVKELLRQVSKLDFQISAIIVDKSKVKPISTKNFYYHIISELLTKLPLTNASIRIDGSSGTNHMRSAAASFRKNIKAAVNNHPLLDIRFVDSQENNLIQLADLIAGAIFRSTQTNKTDHAEYLKIIKKRILNVYHYEDCK